MAKKTCVKQAYKYWPKTDRLEAAIHHLNTEAAVGIDFNGRVQARPDDYNDPEPIIVALRDCTSVAEMKKVWAEKNGLLAKQPQDHSRLKQVYLERREQIKAQQVEQQPEQQPEEAPQ
jgi:recombination protein RecT